MYSKNGFLNLMAVVLGPLVVGSGMDVWKPHGAIGILALLFGLFTMSVVIKLSRNKSKLVNYQRGRIA